MEEDGAAVCHLSRCGEDIHNILIDFLFATLSLGLSLLVTDDHHLAFAHHSECSLSQCFLF